MALELYSTEEQQAEVLQKFWKQNGKTIIIGILLGVVAILGWDQWKNYKLKVQEENTYTYMTVIKNLSGDYNENTVKATETLIAEKSGTIYAEMAAFNLAALAIDQKGDFEKAQKYLEIASQSKDDALAAVSNLRLARVYAQEQKFDAAYSILNKMTKDIYAPTAYELIGDVKLLQGNRKEAKDAYSKAYDLVKNTDEIQLNQLLKIKLDDLSDVDVPALDTKSEKVKEEAKAEALVEETKAAPEVESKSEEVKEETKVVPEASDVTNKESSKSAAE